VIDFLDFHLAGITGRRSMSPFSDHHWRGNTHMGKLSGKSGKVFPAKALNAQRPPNYRDRMYRLPRQPGFCAVDGLLRSSGVQLYGAPI
jgi:hypothetical protein